MQNHQFTFLAATQTRLADVATGEVVASPNDIARLGFAVAAAVAGEASHWFR